MKKCLILLLAILGCATDKSPIEPGFGGNTILGIWSAPHRNFYFRPDATFTEEMFALTHPGDSSRTVQAVVEGNYELADGTIRLQNLQFTYIDDRIPGVEYVAPTFAYQLSGDTLHITMVNIFECESGTGDELWGRWLENRWECNYKNNPLEKTFSGVKTYWYDFQPDSSDARYGWNYLEGIPGLIYRSAEFQYSPPYLNIDNEPANILVSFANGKMKWEKNTFSYVRGGKK